MQQHAAASSHLSRCVSKELGTSGSEFWILLKLLQLRSVTQRFGFGRRISAGSPTNFMDNHGESSHRDRAMMVSPCLISGILMLSRIAIMKHDHGEASGAFFLPRVARRETAAKFHGDWATPAASTGHGMQVVDDLGHVLGFLLGLPSTLLDGNKEGAEHVI